MSTRLRMLPLAVVGALALVLSGCSGSDDASDSTTTEAKKTTTTESAGAAPEGASPECEEVLAAFEGLNSEELASSLTDGANPSEQFQQVADAMQTAQENAPEEIAVDLQTLTDSYQQLASSADQIDWKGIAENDPAASAAAGELMQGFASQDLADAGQRVSDWLNEHCLPGS